MSYLLFNTLSSFAPQASAASQSHTFQYPSTALSAASYVFTVGGSTGVFGASALVAGAVVSAAQVSAATTTFTLTPTQVPAGSQVVIQTAYVSGGIVPQLKVTANVGASAVGGEWQYLGSTYTFGSGNGGASLNPVISAAKVNNVSGTLTYTTALAVSSLTTTTTLSTDHADTELVLGNTYVVQGDAFGFNTAQVPLSSLDGVTASFVVNTDLRQLSLPRDLPTHLRLRNQGYI